LSNYDYKVSKLFEYRVKEWKELKVCEFFNVSDWEHKKKNSFGDSDKFSIRNIRYRILVGYS
jgi:hypothetical protein